MSPAISRSGGPCCRESGDGAVGGGGYLQAVARAFLGIAIAAGLAAKFQVGEPWWWVMPDGRPCLYDASAVAAFSPVAMGSILGPKTPARIATLDAAGVCLAASTAALVGAVRAEAPGCVTHLLTYLPTVLDAAAPEAKRANMPVGWANPAFDVLQLEDSVCRGSVERSSGYVPGGGRGECAAGRGSRGLVSLSLRGEGGRSLLATEG